MEGMHWVGDLIAEWDLETSEDATACQFRIIEAGIAYVCDLELKSGTATLRIVDKRPDGAGEAAKPEFTDGTRSAVTVSGPSGVLAGERHQIRFSNADDQLRLWVDDELVEFDGPTTFDHRQYLSEQQDRPYYTEADPLDAAPVMLGIRGGEATAHHMKVMRDKYYIALRGEMQNFHDYDAPPSFSAGEPVDQQLRIQRRLSTPSTWATARFGIHAAPWCLKWAQINSFLWATIALRAKTHVAGLTRWTYSEPPIRRTHTPIIGPANTLCPVICWSAKRSRSFGHTHGILACG